jgi:hypothetical protein
MQKTLISLAIQGLLGIDAFSTRPLYFGFDRRPLWTPECPVRVTNGGRELVRGVDYEYDADKGTVHFLRPVNGVVHVTRSPSYWK